jgi:uncharacterized protein YkwD
MLFLAILPVLAQDSVEKQLFFDINHYRDSVGLQKLQWDSLAYKAAKHHADYLATINNSKYHKGLITHDEQIDVDNVDEYSLGERFQLFIPKHKKAVENAGGGTVSNSFGKKTVTIKIAEISNSLLNMWIGSDAHKKNLERKEFTKGACAITFVNTNVIVDTPTGQQTRTITSYYAVFVTYY